MMKFLKLRLPALAQKNNEGPPDLDQVLRDLSNKINGLFGKKNGGNGGFNNGSNSASDGKGFDLPIIPILALIAAIWLATGFYIVDQGSRGVVLRFGKYVETTNKGPNWHIPYPIETVDIVNVQQVRTLEVGYRTTDGSSTRNKEPHESLMLTDDENIIDLQFAVQYNLKSENDYLFNNRFNQGADRPEEDAVRGIAETSIREVVGKSKMDYVLYEGREDIAVRAKKLIQEVLDRYKSGVNVINVTMQNAQPPEQVQAAFDDAVKAGQDLEKQKNEGQAYANDLIPKARGNAARLLAEADGYKQRVENESKGNASRFDQILTQYNKSPEVTRERIYLDAQEQILSNTSKVIVDQKGGSLLYLPLDKLMATTNAPSGNTSTNAVSSPAVKESESGAESASDMLRNRERGNR